MSLNDCVVISVHLK